MPRTITDFTKSRLTQAFEAKGNFGSELLEQLQPVVVVHSLETGPWPPFIPWHWAADIGPIVAASPAARIQLAGFNSEPQPELTSIIDRVMLFSTVAQTVTVQVGSGGSITTPQTAQPVVTTDLRRGQNYTVTEYQTELGTGAVLGFTGVRTHLVTLPANVPVTLDVRVIMAPRRITGASDPSDQLLVTSSSSNVGLTVLINGRLFTQQS